MRLLLNNLRRTLAVTFLACVAMFGFHLLLITVYVNLISKNTPMIVQNLPKGLQNFFGLDRLPITTITGFLAVAYQHPFVLAAVLAVPISTATLLLAGDVERRSLALILSRPVSRTGVVLACAVTCLVQSLLVVACAYAGTRTGIQVMHVKDSPDYSTLLRVAGNLFSLICCVCGISVMFSALFDQRGDAVGWAFTVTLFMYVWNFFTQIWEEAKPYERFSIFHYYSPTRIFLNTSSLQQDNSLLVGLGVICLLAAVTIFARRDLNV